MWLNTVTLNAPTTLTLVPTIVLSFNLPLRSRRPYQAGTIMITHDVASDEWSWYRGSHGGRPVTVTSPARPLPVQGHAELPA
eukprot:1516018-Rhodomonas_salina.1